MESPGRVFRRMIWSDFRKLALVYANPGEWVSTGQDEEPGWIERNCNYLAESLSWGEVIALGELAE